MRLIYRKNEIFNIRLSQFILLNNNNDKYIKNINKIF